MDTPRYLHLILPSRLRFNLNNVLKGQDDHMIVQVGSEYLDIQNNIIPDDHFDKLIAKAKVIFVHFLDEKKAKILLSLDPTKKVVWFAWGGDMYYLGRFENRFLLEETRKIRLKTTFKSYKGLKDLLKLSLGSLSDLIPPNSVVLKALQRVDLIVPVVDQDYENLAEMYGISIPSFQTNYINDLLLSGDAPEIPAIRNDILLGNSASFSNNHAEIIRKMAQYDLGDSRVIIPLNYGNPSYASYIKNFAKNMLGSNAYILEHFLPFEDYAKLQMGAGTIIMNHTRQQALGNVIMGLWARADIFLNPASGLYRHFTEKGFHILNTENYDPSLHLTDDQKVENRELLFRWHGPVYLRNRFEQLINYLKTL